MQNLLGRNQEQKGKTHFRARPKECGRKLGAGGFLTKGEGRRHPSTVSESQHRSNSRKKFDFSTERKTGRGIDWTKARE